MVYFMENPFSKIPFRKIIGITGKAPPFQLFPWDFPWDFQWIMGNPSFQWEFQDPKMEVLYHIRPYFLGIFPYIGLI